MGGRIKADESAQNITYRKKSNLGNPTGQHRSTKKPESKWFFL